MSGVLFRSSRDRAGEAVPFREALLQGLAPDGGLYLPEAVPDLPAGWRGESRLPGLATRVLQPWLGEPEGAELGRLLEDALDFPVELIPLSRNRFVVELFHGPTLSFKDFGARTMARLMNHYLADSDERLTILVATSGDTGSAVADGFAGMEHLRVVLLYPKGLVSQVQERQLTAARPGLTTLAVRGTFDDCQRMVKAAFANPALSRVGLSSANSINVGRLLPQQLYYIWSVARLQETVAPLVSVPSGNLGNLTAGLLAARSGLPVARFIAAHNANDYFPRFLDGAAAAYQFGDTRATISNAMDVGAPSNFERLASLLPGGAGEEVWGTSVDDPTTRGRMKATFEEDGYVACPHTAVGLEAVERYRAGSGDDRAALILATAHPAKFPEVVADTLEMEPPTHPRLDALLEAASAVTDIPASDDALAEILLQNE